MEKTQVKKILGISYRIFELIVVLLVTVLVVTIGLEKYYDRVDYTDAWEMYLIALTWLFFVSLPLLIVYIVSFFRSLTFRTILHKIIFGGHILNIALWFLFYFMLPKPEPITAAMMEKNYLNHEPEMRDLINYTRSCLEDSTGIDFQMRNGEIVELNVNRLWEAGAFWDKESKSQLDSVIISVGITPAEFDTIQAKMTSAGVIGIKTFRKGYKRPCESLWSRNCSRHGLQIQGYDELWLNDSVSFVNMDNLTGHTFPDRDEFIKKHPQK